jgi:hypothetical protein
MENKWRIKDEDHIASCTDEGCIAMRTASKKLEDFQKK